MVADIYMRKTYFLILDKVWSAIDISSYTKVNPFGAKDCAVVGKWSRSIEFPPNSQWSSTLSGVWMWMNVGGGREPVGVDWQPGLRQPTPGQLWLLRKFTATSVWM